jgi:hypothetical protein
MPFQAHPLAPGPGQPYPATFRNMPAMDSPGVEPGFPPRQGGVVPLDDEPVVPRFEHNSVDRPGCRTPISWVQTRRRSVGPAAHHSRSPRSARESNPVHLPTKEACRHEHLRTDYRSRPGRTRTCASLFVRQGPWPLGDGTMKDSVSSRDGIRTHKHQPLVLAALPFAYPAVGHSASFCPDGSGYGSRTPSVRVYETRLGTGPPANPRPRYRTERPAL